jgi:hypothetical protein
MAIKDSQRNRLIIGAVLIFLFAGGNWITQIRNQVPSLAPCYYQKTGSTDTLMEIKNQNKNEVSGTLVIHNAEKDSSYGTFTGTINKSKLKTSFEFWSEGQLSTREIIYTIENGSLNGEGFSYEPKENCQDLLYEQGLSLIPYKVKLPLHLFSKLWLSYPQPAELLSTFGSRNMLPLDAITINYRESQDKSIVLASYYFWDQKVWQKFSAKKEFPDWGQLVAENDGKVLSVSTVQDCVFEDKTECANITKLYEKIIEKSSYLFHQV